VIYRSMPCSSYEKIWRRRQIKASFLFLLLVNKRPSPGETKQSYTFPLLARPNEMRSIALNGWMMEGTRLDELPTSLTVKKGK
jgi:hypothetical protein